MMIHSLNTSITLAAMTNSDLFYTIAFLTVFKLLDKKAELELEKFFLVSEVWGLEVGLF